MASLGTRTSSRKFCAVSDEADFTGSFELPGTAFHVATDFGTKDFGGAAPPEGHGDHRYAFAVHALGVDSLPIDSDVSPAIA